MKSFFFKIPEYYLIVIACIMAYSPVLYINAIFLGTAFVLLTQIIFNNRIVGLIIGSLFFLVNLFFLGALLSEFAEFNEFNSAAMKLLGVGLTIWLINLLLSSIMIYKYSKIYVNSGGQKIVAKIDIVNGRENTY